MGLYYDLLANMRGLFSSNDGSTAPKYDVEDQVNRMVTVPVSVLKHAQDALAATTTDNLYFFYPKYDCVIIDAKILPSAALTADDTDYATITVEDAGGVLCTAATTTAGTGDWTAGAEEAMTISDPLVAAGDSVKLKIAKAASGVQLDPFTVMLYVRYTS